MSLYGIMRSNSLREGAYWDRVNEPHGPRLADTFKHAKDYAKFSAHMNDPNGVVLELDGKKLAQIYEFVKYRDVDANGDLWTDQQFEFVPLTKLLKPIKPFIIAIYIGSDTRSWHDPSNPDFYSEEYGLPGKAADKWIRDFVASKQYKIYKTPKWS
jgi:hypothetical protein